MAGKRARRHPIGQAAEIAPGQRKVVEIAGREIGVFNLDGSYYALLNRCPHRGGPLCHGRLRPLVVVDADGAVDHLREGEILKCPWHQWEFDIKTGRALFDDSLRVRTYRVAVEEGEVVLYF